MIIASSMAARRCSFWSRSRIASKIPAACCSEFEHRARRIRRRRDRRRSGRLSGGDSSRAERSHGSLHRCLEKSRRQQCLRRYLPECRLHTLEGVARVLRTVSALSLIHISEPTRQAEISYAVFCLKKKK